MIINRFHAKLFLYDCIMILDTDAFFNLVNVSMILKDMLQPPLCLDLGRVMGWGATSFLQD